MRQTKESSTPSGYQSITSGFCDRNEANRPLLKLEPKTFKNLYIIFDFAQTIVSKYYSSKNGENSIGNESFSDTKRPAKLSSIKSYHSFDKILIKNEN